MAPSVRHVPCHPLPEKADAKRKKWKIPGLQKVQMKVEIIAVYKM